MPSSARSSVGSKTEVGDGVEAFGGAADGIGEAAAAPLVGVLDLAAAFLDEVAHAVDGGGEPLVAHVGANDQYQFVISHEAPRRDKAKRPRGGRIQGPPSRATGL